MTNEFLVSVADVILRDPQTKAGIAYGKANISSAFNLSMSSADVRAGINNPLIYSYYHTRELGITVNQAIFTETILALNAGATVSTGADGALFSCTKSCNRFCIDVKRLCPFVIIFSELGIKKQFCFCVA